MSDDGDEIVDISEDFRHRIWPKLPNPSVPPPPNDSPSSSDETSEDFRQRVRSGS